MSRNEVEPTKRDSDHPQIDDHILEHPAFGNVVVTHWHGSGRGQRLFGSDLGHNSGMTLCFSECDMHRGLSNDHHYSRNIILKVDISESQWARIVSSTGNGGGTPVTIRERCVGPLKSMPAIAAPEASKREVHGEEMATSLRKAMKTAQDAAAKLGELLEKPGSISKTELKAIYAQLSRPIDYLPGTVQFIYDQFAEATEKVAEDSKLEIEAHIMGMATLLGLEQLREIAPRFEDDSKKPAALIENNDA